VQLFARLEKIFHKQLPLATLFEAQTVEKLAAIISSKDWKPSWASLVPIQPGGSKPLFFCVHGAGGNVLLYRDLARHMGADQPFYGLQSKGLDGKQPFHTRIEDMAADYIQEIRQLQPKGPYYLGGYCLGGAIAFEIARYLVQQGQTVAFVAMFDTQRQFKTDFKPLINWYQRYQQIAFHIGNFLQVDMQGKRGFLLEKASEAGRRIRRRYHIARSEIAYALKMRVDKPLVLMEKINDRALELYQPAPYPGRVTLFCPRINYAGYNDPLYGWGNGLTAGVDVQQLSSYPAGMLVEPFVAELAEKLKACLENAYAQQGSATAP
jgi:thioesterase domain-containing protein